MRAVSPKTAAVSLAGVALAAAFLFFLHKPAPDAPALHGVFAGFMDCLPGELTDAQREEIRGILLRYELKAEAGNVRPQDHLEIDADLKRFVEAGTIARSDLSRFMAKVSLYTYRLDPEHSALDTWGKHPLLMESDSLEGKSRQERRGSRPVDRRRRPNR